MNVVKVGVGVFVRNKEGKILMQKRIGAHGSGSWSLPGGHLEFGEEIEHCASREAREEMDVEIKNVKVIGFTNDFMHSDGKHYVTFFVDSELANGEAKIMEPDKSSDFGWFSKDNLPSPLFMPLENFMKNRHCYKLV